MAGPWNLLIKLIALGAHFMLALMTAAEHVGTPRHDVVDVWATVTHVAVPIPL